MYVCPITLSSTVCEAWKSIALLRSNWLPKNCREAFAHFGQMYFVYLIFVKYLPIFVKVDLYAWQFNENRKNCMY